MSNIISPSDSNLLPVYQINPPPIHDEESTIFETKSLILFSNIEKKLGLTLSWKGWKSRSIIIKSNGILTYSKSITGPSISGFYDLSKV